MLKTRNGSDNQRFKDRDSGRDALTLTDRVCDVIRLNS